MDPLDLGLHKLDQITGARDQQETKNRPSVANFQPELRNAAQKNHIGPESGFFGVLEKRLSNGWRKRQVTLVVSHKARP